MFFGPAMAAVLVFFCFSPVDADLWVIYAEFQQRGEQRQCANMNHENGSEFGLQSSGAKEFHFML